MNKRGGYVMLKTQIQAGSHWLQNDAQNLQIGFKNFLQSEIFGNKTWPYKFSLFSLFFTLSHYILLFFIIVSLFFINTIKYKINEHKI